MWRQGCELNPGHSSGIKCSHHFAIPASPSPHLLGQEPTTNSTHIWRHVQESNQNALTTVPSLHLLFLVHVQQKISKRHHHENRALCICYLSKTKGKTAKKIRAMFFYHIKTPSNILRTPKLWTLDYFWDTLSDIWHLPMIQLANRNMYYIF